MRLHPSAIYKRKQLILDRKFSYLIVIKQTKLGSYM